MWVDVSWSVQTSLCVCWNKKTVTSNFFAGISPGFSTVFLDHCTQSRRSSRTLLGHSPCHFQPNWHLQFGEFCPEWCQNWEQVSLPEDNFGAEKANWILCDAGQWTSHTSYSCVAWTPLTPHNPGGLYIAHFQHYLPSIFMVLFSWITFWVEMDTGNKVSFVYLSLCSSTETCLNCVKCHFLANVSNS